MKNKGTKLGEWQKRVKGIPGICARCGKERELTVDHIVPQHLLEELGLIEEVYEDEENFEYLCYACNKFKGGRVDIAHKKTVQLLCKYVGKL